MNLNDRFTVSDDDTCGQFSCTTCGAIVDFKDLDLHNDWHTNFKSNAVTDNSL